MHPDKALARTTARHRLAFPPGDTDDEARLKTLFQALNEAYHALRRWIEEQLQSLGMPVPNLLALGAFLDVIYYLMSWMQQWKIVRLEQV